MGVSAFVLIVIIAALVVGYRTGKRRDKGDKPVASEDKVIPRRELDAEGTKSYLHRNELGHDGVLYEVNDQSRPAEADNMNVRAELEGG